MRLIQISVRDDRRESILEVLRQRTIGYTVTEGAADASDRTTVSFVVPADAVEHVLADLREQGLDESAFTVSLKTEFANVEHVDELLDRWGASPNRLAPDALRSKARDLRRNTRSYLWMMILSAVVATAGLLLGSPAVVVGSMVIAPIVSPVLTADVGIVRNDRDMLVDSLHMQMLGLIVAVLTAAAFAMIVRQTHVVAEPLAVEQMDLLRLRLAPGILTAVVGVAAGAAGAYGLATKGQVSIIGVMIAAALIPTAATAGVGIASWNPVLALGALWLLVVSIVGVNVGGAAMLFYLDYRPDDVDEGILTVDDARRAAVVVSTLVLVVGIVAVTGIAFLQQSAFERGVHGSVTDVLDDEEYRDLGVRSISTEYTAPMLSERTVVTITLTRTTDESVPELPDVLAQRIADRTGRNVVVRIQYVDYEQSAVQAGTATTRQSASPRVESRRLTTAHRVVSVDDRP